MSTPSSLNSNPFFQLEDFKSLEFNLQGLNLTSKIKLPKDGLALVQFEEAGVLIELPSRSCAVGHQLALVIRVKWPREEGVKDSKTEITGIVSEIESLVGERQLVHLEFRQYSKEQWDTFVSYLVSKQTRLNRLVRMMRK